MVEPLTVALGASAAVNLGLGLKSLFSDTPEPPGPTGEQRQILGVQTQELAKASELTGLTSQQVSRLQQAGFGAVQQQAQQVATAMPGLSPLERQRVTNALLSATQQTTLSVQQQIAEFDARAEAQRISAISALGGQAAQTAETIRRAEVAQEQAKLQREQAKLQQFVSGVQSTLQLIGAASAIPGAEPTPRTDVTAAGGLATVEGQVATGGLLQSPQAQQTPAAIKAAEAVTPVKQEEQVSLLNMFQLIP